MNTAKEETPVPNRLLRIRLSLNGRPLKSFVFDKDVIIVGRDPECDVVLENTGVSRHHVKFELCPSGFYSVTDMESANGTLFNDQPLTKDYIYNNAGDIVQIGKFTLWVSREPDRRYMMSDRRPTPEAHAHTTVLSAEDMEKLGREARQHCVAGSISPAAPVPEASAYPQREPRSTAHFPWMATSAAFVLGAASGALGFWLLGR